MKADEKIILDEKIAVDYLIEKLFKEGVINYETYEKIAKTVEGRQYD